LKKDHGLLEWTTASFGKEVGQEPETAKKKSFANGSNGGEIRTARE
jgi:hypothetical protein